MNMQSILFAALGLISAGALAQDDAGADAAAAAPDAPQVVEGVKYLCGGIGENNAAKMKELTKDYNLMLTFATRDGHYLADVDVNIDPKRGDAGALTATCDGPLMLIKLPQSGAYTIEATTGGISETKTVQVSTKGSAKHVTMTWPNQPFIAQNEPLRVPEDQKKR